MGRVSIPAKINEASPNVLIVESVEPNSALSKQLSIAAELGPVAGNSSLFSRRAIGSLLTIVWVIGGMVLITSLLLSIFACTLAARSESVLDDAPSERWAVNTANTVSRLSDGTMRVPRIVVTEAISIPFTIGLFRPVVVLPKDAWQWSSTKLEMVLAHELAHIQRRDVAWHWLLSLAACLAWLNPLMWFAVRRCVIERERVCDDRVIQVGYNPCD